MLRLGAFELHSLTDGTFRLDGGAMFGVVPKTLWSKRTQADDKLRIPLGLRPLLVRANGKNILIDTGIGDKMPPKLVDIYAIDRTTHLDHSLAAIGKTADDIDVVIATHLHFDHFGGSTRSEGGTVVPRFRNARYLIRRGDWEDATHPHDRNRASYLPENFMPLADAGVIDFVEDDGEVLPGISVWRTGGHAMFHQWIKVESEGRVAAFVADLIPTTAHLDEPWIMGYDLYPMDTLHYKQRFIREAIDGEYVVFFEHDPVTPAGIIRERDGKRSVEPVAV
ncbi:MAG: MBL fold metallo-hydrolase [Acidobacteria bacterium]|nr:MBL fold metallo-hydrolase [Acidobacteriota bacterium]